jgi:hypothetical protein
MTHSEGLSALTVTAAKSDPSTLGKDRAVNQIMVEMYDHRNGGWRTAGLPAVSASRARAFLADKDESQFRAVDWRTREPVDIWTGRQPLVLMPYQGRAA